MKTKPFEGSIMSFRHEEAKTGDAILIDGKTLRTAYLERREELDRIRQQVVEFIEDDENLAGIIAILLESMYFESASKFAEALWSASQDVETVLFTLLTANLARMACGNILNEQR